MYNLGNANQNPFNQFMSKPNNKRREKEPRVNSKIRSAKVLLIDSDGNKLGEVPIKKALASAEEAGLDLVEIAAQANPPVCKIVDYSKFRYEQQVAAKRAKKNQVLIKTKEIKFGPATGEHDYNFKTKDIRKFIEKEHHVKVTVAFKGRENTHVELGFNLLERVAEDLIDIADIESKAKRSGRAVSMLLVPKK